MLKRSRGPAFALATICCAAVPAGAGPYSEVASATDDDDPFDLHVWIDYEWTGRTATVKRERVGDAPAGAGDPIPVGLDLVAKSSRHTIVPRAELGIYKGLALTFALPYVVLDTRQLELDQRDTPCDFTTGQCIDRATSSTILDGLLGPDGFDADDPTTNFPGDGALIFRGVDRKGLEHVAAGFVWAPMEQRRDDTKPTWKLGAELRIAVGKTARFDASDPERRDGISSGVHELKVYSSMAKRIGWAEPYFEGWWLAPVGAKDASPFDDPGFGAKSTQKQQQAGTRFGFEAIAVDRGPDRQRVSLDLSAKLVSHFEGRGYSEMWEVFALAGDTETGGPLVLDSDPLEAGVQAMSHPGITNIENYLEMGGRLAVRADLGPLVHIAAIGEFSRESTHVITFTDAGIDLPPCTGTGTPGEDCELDSNDVVDPGTNEVNPLHSSIIDLVGHRYISDEGLSLRFGVQVRVLF